MEERPLDLQSCRAACEALYDILPENAKDSALFTMQLLENCQMIESCLAALCGQVDPVMLYHAVPEALWPELDSLLTCIDALLTSEHGGLLG